MKNKISYLIRWVLLLPSCFIVYYIVRGLALASLRTAADNYSVSSTYIMFYVISVIVFVFAGYVFIDTGNRIAPLHKKYALIIVSLIFFIFCITALVLMIIKKEFIFMPQILAQMFGAMVSYIIINKKGFNE